MLITRSGAAESPATSPAWKGTGTWRPSAVLCDCAPRAKALAAHWAQKVANRASSAGSGSSRAAGVGVFPLLQLSSKLFLQGSKLFLVLLQGCKLLLDASDGMVRLWSRAASSVHVVAAWPCRVILVCTPVAHLLALHVPLGDRLLCGAGVLHVR